MQVKRSNSTTFSPYTITISIERPEDEYVLRELSKQQYTIPEILFPREKYYHTKLQDFLNQLMKSLAGT